MRALAMKWTACLLVLLSLSGGQASSQEWGGHLATLAEAKIACSDSHSKECEPFLAQAVAVVDVMKELSFVDTDAKGDDFVVIPFPHGKLTHCSQRWMTSMNGLALLHLTLGSGAFDENKSTYWTHALMQVSRQLCHS
jgi:hypothetical protein